MTMITSTFGRLWIFPLPLVFFAMTLSVANAQTKIGTAQSVKPQAEGSVAGTLAAGSGVHENETVKTGSSGQAGLRFIDESNLLSDRRHRSDSTSLCMIQTRVPAPLLLRARGVHFDSVRAPKTRVTLKSRRLPAPLAFAVELYRKANG
jgi:hypothetical protein